MNKLFNSTLLLPVVVVLYNFLVSCAVPGTIDGGKKDSIPPYMVASRPILADTIYKGKKVLIQFNEFFTLKDINQEFYSSPPFEEMPDFKTKKKGLLVKFKEPLKDSVTYTLNFGNSITDYNEGNVLKKFKFVFSTKSNVDSFSIGGSLRNAKDQSAPKKTTVMLFENIEDSIPYKSLPLYMAMTDSSGNFNIDYIRPGSYKIFALTDKNNNQLADFFEDRAFLDSLIVPKRSTYLAIDSLEAGTILHDTITNETDSLESDSVIIRHKDRTSPANLRLYLFTENNQVQKVEDYNRKERYKVDISFFLPLTPKFNINPINFKIEPNDIIYEKNQANDSITWWIINPKIQAMDSLEVNLIYESKDSVGNPMMESDTLLFEYRPKKEKDVWKKKSKEKLVVKQEYLKLNYLAKDSKVDLNKSLRIESPTPLSVVDTSKIKLFEIIDTSVIDTKEQKILKALRLQKDLLTFKFKRPIASEFSLYPINFKAENWYTTAASDSNTFYTCQITDPSVAAMDTLKLIVDYDNHFFMKQIQVLSDTAILPISNQKILSRKRNEADKINLAFYKPLKSTLQLTPSDFKASPNWYQTTNSKGNDSVTIAILDKNVSIKDTLTLSVKSFDYIGLKGDSIFFTETMRITLKEEQQYLASVDRPKKEEVVLSFNKKMGDNPVLEPINFTANQPWYQIERNAVGDSLKIKISNDQVFSKDTLGIIVKYNITSSKGIITNYNDTVKLRVKQNIELKKKTESEITAKTVAKPQVVPIYVATDYKIEIDSMYVRQRLISKEWKEKTKYLLRLDSMAFINVFNIFVQNEDYKFESQPAKYYASILLNLTNTKPVVQAMLAEMLKDSIKPDSLKLMQYQVTQKEVDSYIGNGNMIIQLLGEKDVLVKEYFSSKDEVVKMDFLAPGKYKIKIIFDKNGNGKWDTGDYFKHIQPERVITNGEEIVLKTGFELELDWPVGKTLIQSFTKKMN